MINKPPGWLYLTALSAVVGVILYWASVPHWYVVEMFLVGFFVGIPLWAIWAVHLGLAVGRGTAYAQLSVGWCPYSSSQASPSHS